MATGKCMICHDDTDELISPHHSEDTGHLVHRECIMNWINTSHSLLCPLCRQRLNPPIYKRDTFDNNGFLLQAASENNWELINELELSQVSSKIVLQALQIAAQEDYLDVFELILTKIADRSGTIEMPGFFEFLCGKCVSLQVIRKLDGFVSSTQVASIDCDYDVWWASMHGPAEIVKYLVFKGAAYKTEDGCALPEHID